LESVVDDSQNASHLREAFLFINKNGQSSALTILIFFILWR